MKKRKLCLIPLASLLLSGCTWEEFKSDTWVGRSIVGPIANLFDGKDEEEVPSTPAEDPEGGESSDTLTPEQRESATKCNDLIYSFVKDDFSEEVAESTKEYIFVNSEYIAAKGVDALVITDFIDSVKELSVSDPLAILNLAYTLQMSGAAFDLVYFGTALGKCYLKAGAESDQENAEMYTYLLTSVEEEGDALPDNAVAVASKVLDVAVDSVSLISKTEILGLISSILGFEPLKANDLKLALKDIADLMKELVPVKENVKYFGEFAKKLISELPAFEELPESITSVFEALEFGALIDSLFNIFDTFGDKVDALPDRYFEHLDEIEKPIESYVYAVLGLVDSLLPKVDLNSEEIAKLPDQIIETVSSIIALIKAYVEEAEAFITELMNNEHVQALLDALVNIALHLSSFESEVITVENISQVISEAMESISSLSTSAEGEFLTVEELKEEVFPSSVSLPISTLESAILDRVEYIDAQYDVYTECSPEVGEDGLSSFDIVRYSYNFEYIPGESEEYDSLYTYYYYEVQTVTYSNMVGVAQYAKDVLSELIAQEESIDYVIDDLSQIANALIGLFDDYSKLLPIPEEDLETILAVKEIVAALVSNDENVEFVKGGVINLLASVNNLLDVFVGESPKSNFGEVVAFIAYRDLSSLENVFYFLTVFMQKYYDAELAPLGDLFLDVYKVAEVIELKDAMIDAIAEGLASLGLFDYVVESLRAAESAEDFKAALYDNFLYMLLHDSSEEMA